MLAGYSYQCVWVLLMLFRDPNPIDKWEANMPPITNQRSEAVIKISTLLEGLNWQIIT
jgi:hypothetical protein